MGMISGLFRNIGARRGEGVAVRAREAREAGMRFVRQDDFLSAERCFRNAVRLEPRDPDARAFLANSLYLGGKIADAEAEYQAALAMAPDHPAARTNLGLLLRDSGRGDAALDQLARVLDADPSNDAALRALASLVGAVTDGDRLVGVAASSVARAASCARAHAVLGFLRLKLAADPMGALEHLDAAIALDDGDPDAHGNRGIALQDLGRIEEALAAYDKALARAPANPVHAWHRSLALLLLGRYEEGWQGYELRLQSADRPVRPFPQTRWNGQPLQGRTLLIHAEQGLGDEIMFASCYRELTDVAGHCIIECHPKLESLFRRSFPTASIRAGAQDRDLSWLAGFPPADFQCPAGSIPAVLRRTQSSFPKHAGYLKADPDRVEHWRQRIAQTGKQLAVGISWRGGTRVSRAPMRSMTPEQWLPLIGSLDVLWVCLQYDAAPAEVAEFAGANGLALVHWQDAIDDYDETAALICALDCVASVCTAVIHLGGALGRPVSVLAPLSPEWRYGAQGDGMPWYPSVKVHRQRHFGDWSYPLDRTKQDILAIRARRPAG